MAKFQSPLLGYNNNVRHRGRIFHIQTEDSGVNHPHIITHLFMDGGRILKSVKKSYAEHVGNDGMSETVRVMMKEQHKAMFIALRDGQFDDLFEGGKKASGSVAPPAATAVSPPVVAPTPPLPNEMPPTTTTEKSFVAPPPPRMPKEVPPAATTEKSFVAADSAPHLAAADVAINDSPVVSVVTVSSAGKIPVAAEAAPVSNTPPPPFARSDEVIPRTIDERPASVAPARMPSMDPPLPPEVEALLRDELPPKPVPAPPRERAEPKAAREDRHRSAQELTLDFDALQRDSGESSIFQQGDLPPPPKNLFAKEPRTGTYSAVEADAHHDATRSPGNRPHVSPSRLPPPDDTRPASAVPRASVPPPPLPPSIEGRQPHLRPAASFGAQKQPTSPSIFSDDLVSDKSLDEVILSYLAEDLDPPRRK